MEIARDIQTVRGFVDRARSAGRSIGFVPTMGALHAGHVSLIEAARRDAAFVVVSIFVNPTQFGPNEDFAKYPRDEAGDLARCDRAGAELVFLPPVEVMYPPGAETSIHVARLTDTLCGPLRPGHFDGVATVVAKLFNIVRPDRAYFGEKDAQQLAVLRRMTLDLDLPIELVGCPIVREPDGLAMSSRNAYLSPAERKQAPCLYRSLRQAAERIAGGQTNPETVLAAMRETILAAGPARIEYVSIVDPDALQPVARIDRRVLIALAVRIGATRLIDNLQVDPNAGRR
jgi:pantoate--beta-alanine ligase